MSESIGSQVVDRAMNEQLQPMIRPVDGKVVGIPAQNVQRAIESGYILETPEQTEKRLFLQENDSLGTSVGVAARALGDQLLFGVPGIVYDNVADEDDVIRRRWLQEDNKAAFGAGSVAGFVGSLATGAPLFRAAEKAGKGVRAAVAGEKVAEGAGVAARTVANARGAAGAALGGATEGLIGMAPIVSAEALLGDPDRAAEAALMGGGFGALVGSTLGAAGKIYNLSRDATEQIARRSGQLADQSDNLMAVGGKYVAGSLVNMDGDDLAYFARNYEEIVGDTLDRPGMIELMEDLYGEVASRSNQIGQDAALLKQQLKDAVRAKRDELRNFESATPAAQRLGDSIDEAKRVVGDFGAEARQLLDETPAFKNGFRVSQFDELLSRAVDDVGEGIGESSVAAINRIEGYRKRILDWAELRVDDAMVREGMTARDLAQNVDITPSEMKNILREIDDDITWDFRATDFNKAFDRQMKAVRKELSDVLKKEVDGYADIMDQMSPYLQGLQNLGKHFKGDSADISKFKNLYKGDNTDLAVREAVESWAELTGDDALARSLREIKTNRELLDAQKLDDETLATAYFSDMKADERAAFAAKDAADKELKKLRRAQNPENLINSARRRFQPENDKRTIRELNRIAAERGLNIDFDKQIYHRRILDQFDMFDPDGSRKVTALGGVGAAGGAMIGGPVGAAVGFGVGSLAGLAANQWSRPTMKAFLMKNPKTALLFLEGKLNEVVTEMDNVGARLERAANRSGGFFKPSGRQAGFQGATQALSRSAGITGLIDMFRTSYDIEVPHMETDAQRLEFLDEQFGSLLSDPNRMIESAGNAAAQLEQNGAPETAQAFAEASIRTVQYLHAQLPKNTSGVNVYADDIPWQPNPIDVETFQIKAMVAQEPLTVLDALESGTLTPHHIDALRNVYPAMNDYFVLRTAEAVAEREKPLPYSVRVQLSQLLGTALDPTMEPERIAASQMAYQQQPQDDAGEELFRPSRTIDIAEDHMTATQGMRA